MALVRQGCTKEPTLRAIILTSTASSPTTKHRTWNVFSKRLLNLGLTISKDEYYDTYLGMDERTCAAALLLKRDGRCDPVIHTGSPNGKRRCSVSIRRHERRPFSPGVRVCRTSVRALPAGHRIGRPTGTFSPPSRERPSSDDSNSSCPRTNAPSASPIPRCGRIRASTAQRPQPQTTPPSIRRMSVIEDSPRRNPGGAEGRHACPAVATTYPAAQLTEAHLVLPSLEEIQPNDVARRLFSRRRLKRTIHLADEVRDRERLEGNTNAHLKLVRHHALPMDSPKRCCCGRDGCGTQGPITFRHIAPPKPAPIYGINVCSLTRRRPVSVGAWRNRSGLLIILEETWAPALRKSEPATRSTPVHRIRRPRLVRFHTSGIHQSPTDSAQSITAVPTSPWFHDCHSTPSITPQQVAGDRRVTVCGPMEVHQRLRAACTRGTVRGEPSDGPCLGRMVLDGRVSQHPAVLRPCSTWYHSTNRAMPVSIGVAGVEAGIPHEIRHYGIRRRDVAGLERQKVLHSFCRVCSSTSMNRGRSTGWLLPML